MERILSPLLELLLPLRGLNRPQGVQWLLKDLGYALPESVTLPGVSFDFTAPLTEGLALVTRLHTAPTLAERLLAVARADDLVRSVWSGARELSALLGASLESVPRFVSKTRFTETFPPRLLDYLIVESLRQSPRSLAVLELLGLVSEVRQAENLAEFESACILRVVHYERLPLLFQAPRRLANEVYRWESNFDSQTFLGNLSAVMRAFGLLGNLLPDDAPGFDAAKAKPAELRRQIVMPLVSGGAAGGGWQLGVRVESAEPGGNQKRGLMLIPYAEGAVAAGVSLADGLSLGIDVGTGLERGVGVVLRPPAALVVQRDLFSQPGSGADVNLGLELRYASPTGEVVLLGSAGASRLAARELRLSAHIRGSGDAEIALALPDWVLVVAAGEGDRFVREILAELSLELHGSTRLGLSLADGFFIESAADLQLVIPVYRALGPVFVDQVVLGLALDAEALRLDAGVTGSAKLGPLTLTLENVGLRSYLEWGAERGLFGSVDVGFAFRPPDGVGLAIEAGPISGGGFLKIAAERGEYSGAFELDLLGIGVAAVGMITTQLPGGADGWSMFVSLSATFDGLQLGFGFTLEGVGGLIGIHRGLDEVALGDGVRSGALQSILFPTDVVANAPRILADMAAVFPPAPGQFVFGPVCKLGWGTPTLIAGELAVVLQLPEPLTVSLLGSLEAVLPHADAPIVELRADVAGTLNLTEGTLRVDASLTDSRVAGIALHGDMAIRASFVDAPSFLFSFGGFHPAFTPPAGFPTLARLGIGLDTGDNLRISLGGYFAITSSTLQFGAKCELWARAAGFTAEGGTSFDALIVFQPFGFDVAMKAWMTISVGQEEILSVLLAGRLKGPSPWLASGLARFRLLGIRQSLEVEARIGRNEAEPPRATIDVGALLLAALAEPDAWTVVPPASGSGVVLGEPSGDELALHPAGALEVRQRIVPLGRRIDHYGNAELRGADTFELTKPRVGDHEARTSAVNDWFAAAQYWALSDAERLAAPSFEPMAAGLRFEGGEVLAGRATVLTADYEVKYRDGAGAGASPRPATIVPAQRLASRGARFASAGRAGKLAPGTQRGPSVAPVAFVAVQRQTGAPFDAAARPEGYHAARERVRRSARSASLVVVPEYEEPTE